MSREIKDLIELSRFFGADRNFVIAGGGNTSFKDENIIWVKASGHALATLSEDGLVALNREKLRRVASENYSDDPLVREDQIKKDLFAAITGTGQKNRPSVETSLHEMISYKYVVHLHPSLANGVLCSRNAKNLVSQYFGEEALFVNYTDPGYTLFKKLENEILSYRTLYSKDPQIIMLENHGVFVSADSANEIRQIYSDIMEKLEKHIKPESEPGVLHYNTVMNKVLPVIRMMLSGSAPKVIRYRNNSLLAKYYSSQQEFQKISHPLTPDVIVYCKSRYIYIDQSSSPERIIDSFRMQLPRFLDEHGHPPKVIVIKEMGVFAVEDSCSAADTVLDVFEDNIRMCHYALQCGGIKFLTPEQVAFIDNWEAENYRRKVAKQGAGENRLAGKTAIVTGGAQGFGAGIAEALFRLNMNVVIADVNEESGNKLAGLLMNGMTSGKALFVRTDVSDPDSVKELITRSVSEFGGLDILISNAGILKAGSLEEMEPDIFSRVTGINYNGYYYCVKYASEVMKLQSAENPEYYSDIIQINSKSGLRGSNRNFAYSGAKFGGIGLTQSFAMELAPFRIKVNAICPGNFYEGPLWSDPQTGLFVQYLKTGKVPGAKTIDDVRKYYEEQVPMKRGCRLEDVMKALLYIIDQEYETGQAVPVTGGQVMLG